jgi:hypothetical protein
MPMPSVSMKLQMFGIYGLYQNAETRRFIHVQQWYQDTGNGDVSYSSKFGRAYLPHTQDGNSEPTSKKSCILVH